MKNTSSSPKKVAKTAKYEPTKVALGVATVAAITLLVFAIVLRMTSY